MNFWFHHSRVMINDSKSTQLLHIPKTIYIVVPRQQLCLLGEHNEGRV